MVTLFEYPSCSTCRKARKWLDEHGISYERRHLVDATPSAGELVELHERSGLPIKKFFNASGGSYREGDFKEKLGNMSLDDSVRALSEDGMLIKRPILATSETALVGFREADYEQLFS